MPRRAKGLTAAGVANAGPGAHYDRDGLRLEVGAGGAASWVFRFKGSNGKPRDMGLGSRRDVSLKLARERVRELREAVRAGRDPLAERRAKAADDAKRMTFDDVARMFIDAHERGWRNEKHKAQWRNTLATYASPVVGALPVCEVDTGLVMRIIEPLWQSKPETASRLRGRIESILDYAKARGWREGENSASWRGRLDNLLPKTSRVRRIVHFAALDWRKAGAFMAKLRGTKGVAARALEFTILTAVRSSEARGATWAEIDLAHGGVWTIPAERMKSGREHRVPLSGAAVDVLRQMAERGTDGLVFPGRSHDRPLSDVGLSKVAKAASASDATVHGFRSTFRDWCAERTSFPRELAEAALAHAVRDPTERSYQRGDLLEKRRAVMAAWASFCGEPMTEGKVLTLARKPESVIHHT